MPHLTRHLAAAWLGLSTALSALPALASPIQAYDTCLTSLVRLTGYLGYLENQGQPLSGPAVAAYHADMSQFVTMGITRFGEPAVRALIEGATTPNPDWIRAAVTLYETDGAEQTFLTLARQVAPCGGPQGHLTQYFAP